ncbi:hypothetical protein B0H10DRAFT_1288223 [Mycena sp. CBHHK59/15]|nr:hypothetical protein B0H10DRAFT_1288223 [Mycena sp. CBHHK59/15]
MSQGSPTSNISFDIPAARQRACLNCRRARSFVVVIFFFLFFQRIGSGILQKCDAERPSCGQCSRSNSFQDCEYAEDGPTRTQILEEQIAILEACIEELEKPKDLRSSLVLQDPYPAEHRSATMPSLSYSDISLSGRSIPLSMPNTPSERVPLVEMETLVTRFLHHGSQFGFFLNAQNFCDAAMGRTGQPPAAVLLDVVYLWAIHLSGSDRYIAYEASYLSRALQTGVDALSSTHYNAVLHTIQAEVLLAQYFLQNTRFLEGKYHLSAAVSLVISSGLHRIRSADSYAVGGPLGPAFHVLTPPGDEIEESERINAFWTVLTLNNCWTTADGSPSNISYMGADARIDTPWPLDTNALHNQGQSLPHLNMGTVTTFLAGVPDGSTSLPALHAKAGILFEQASRLASQYRLTMGTEHAHQFFAFFNSMDNLIEKFKVTLPAMQSHPTREMLVVHSLVHVATVQLHNRFVVDIPSSRVLELSAAHSIVADLSIVDVNEFGYIDPIMGILWMATCQVLVAELARLRRRRPLNTLVPSDEQSLIDAVESVLAAMHVFAPTCRLMDSQLNAMRQTYQGALN